MYKLIEDGQYGWVLLEVISIIVRASGKQSGLRIDAGVLSDADTVEGLRLSTIADSETRWNEYQTLTTWSALSRDVPEPS